MAQLLTIKRKIQRAIRNAESAEDLADAILEIMQDASEADAETAAATLAQVIYDCQGGGDDYADAA